MNEYLDDPKFRQLCKENRIEYVVTGDRRLHLICSKKPDPSILKAFKELIPPQQQWVVEEGLSTSTKTAVTVMLGFYGMHVEFTMNNGMVIVEVSNASGNIAYPDNDIWNQIGTCLRRDPYLKEFQIQVNGELYRDSTGYTKTVDTSPTEDDNILFRYPEREPAHQETPLLRAVKKGPTPVIKDDRFDYDRDFLPPDVGMDVKILLESCNSVEEFLKKI
jgi:hypothetical protein